MTLAFDIAEDELQIFLAEADEHIQMLDEGLVRLEREGDNQELLQAIFRAAHTLKGSAGVIGHKRMADLTHSMESVLDGLRKGTVTVSPALVDGCLEALDVLKLLRNEVVEDEANPVDVAAVVSRLSALITVAPVRPALASPAPAAIKNLPVAVVAEPAQKPAVAPRPKTSSKSAAKSKSKTPAKNAKSNGKSPKASANGRSHGKTAAKAVKGRARPSNGRTKPASNGRTPTAPEAAPAPVAVEAPRGTGVRVFIAQDSIASAARAFQVLLALQGLGEVLDLQPTQEVIETAMPVREMSARVATDKPASAIRAALQDISELERLEVEGEGAPLPAAEPAPGQAEPPQAEAPSTAAADKSVADAQRLGDMLVAGGHITREQLQAALSAQTQEPPPPHLLGETLIKMGAVTREVLDRAVARQVQDLRTALRAAESAPTERGARGRTAEKTVRTSVERLDSLMNLVGELITDRNRLYQIRGDLEVRFHSEEQVDNLAQTVIHIGRITDQIQEEVMRIRMLPVSNVFNKFPRLVRDVARKAGKQVDLTIRGEDTELDRTVIEEIGDPITHLLRNSVDHGIEPPAERLAAGKPERGVVLLTARHEENHIILTVEDDGRGIDVNRVKANAVSKGMISEAEAAGMTDDEAVDLIFKPGLSTARVVSDISGRGVGMDIVRTNIERLNGSVLVETWPGKGSRFEIVLPLTLAIIPALLVQVGEATFAVPLVTVMETLRVASGEIKTVNRKPVTQLRDHVLPLVPLGQALGFRARAGSRPPSHEYVVAVRWGKMEMGLMVDRLVGEQEMVIKSLGTLMGETPGVSGAAILGDGRVALIVDVPSLFKLAGA